MRNEASYLFADYQLDPLRGTLIDPAGAEVPLRPKPFALLHYLLDHPGRLFGRDELLAALWPGVVVGDDSLTQCVSELRRAFGERAVEVLRTVPRRGYLLVATVERGAGPAEEPPTGHVLATKQRRPPPRLHRRETLFVAPPISQLVDKSVERFVRAFASDLVAELVRFEDLSIVASLDDVLARGFALTLELHESDDTVRVFVRLEDLVTGSTFWTDRIPWQTASRASPPSAVAALAGAIGLQIRRKSFRRAQQTDPERLTARDCLLLGLDLHQKGGEQDTIAARAMFLRATEIDPSFGAPYAWAAFTLMRVVTFAWNAALHGGGAEEAVQLARQAVGLDPESSLCQSALAFALSLNGHWEEAVDIARLALRLSRVADDGTRSACGEVLTAAGHPEETVTAMRETLALDPHFPPRARAVLGRALLLANEPDEALRELRRCAVHLPDYAPCARTMVVAATEVGLIEEARNALLVVRRLRPEWLPGGDPIFWFLRRAQDIERFESAFAIAQRLDAAGSAGGIVKPSVRRS